jgi:hypothetical protein
MQGGKAMGFEMEYQAIPPDCGLIELALSDPDEAWGLSLVPSWFSRKDDGPAPGREGKPRDNPIWDACCRLAGIYPDLRTRNCYLDRRWDVLHFLLSATRRDEPATATDLVIDRAFNAGELIADYVQAGQGVPVRYLSPAAVSEIAAVLEPLDRDALARHYDPVRMDDEVYKFSAKDANEVEWERIVGYFTALRSFFLTAAGAGDAVIVCKD